MLLRDCPPISVKKPPAKTLPSACTARQRTSSLAFGLNESANPVVGSSRAMLLRVCPPILVKKPPAKILPSGCTTMAKISGPFAFGSNESARPLVHRAGQCGYAAVHRCC